MKRLLIIVLFILPHLSAFSQSEEWRKYCSLNFQAKRAFEQKYYDTALCHYQQMLHVYGQIVDYADLRNFCMAAVMNGDSSSTAVPSNVQGVCPTGWHVPSAAEWVVMQDYVSTQNDCQCGHRSDLIATALSSTTAWESSTIYCSPGYLPMYNNATGFSALPAGYYYGGGYSVLGREALFWSTTEAGINCAAFRNILNVLANFQKVGSSNHVGLSVRCLKD